MQFRLLFTQRFVLSECILNKNARNMQRLIQKKAREWNRIFAMHSIWELVMFAPCCNFYGCKFGIRTLDPGCNLAGNFYIYFGCLSSVNIYFLI